MQFCECEATYRQIAEKHGNANVNYFSEYFRKKNQGVVYLNMNEYSATFPSYVCNAKKN